MTTCGVPLSRVTLRHLLTMNSGHSTDPTYATRDKDCDWIEAFMRWPFKYEPGTCYCYNSLGTYLLSAAVQKVTGEKVVDYLDTRLWQPLGIEKPFWQESPAGINTGGWGLYIHTEDMARMGLCPGPVASQDSVKAENGSLERGGLFIVACLIH